MTQSQLGELLGKAQPWISKLEDPEYGKVTIATLLEISDAFDVDLEVKFRPFSKALDELSKQGSDYYLMPSFGDEERQLDERTDPRRYHDTATYYRPTDPISPVARAKSIVGPINQRRNLTLADHPSKSTYTESSETPKAA